MLLHYTALTIASDNGDEIQRISESLRPCKDTVRYRIAVSYACSPIPRGKERMLDKKKEREKKGEHAKVGGRRSERRGDV